MATLKRLPLRATPSQLLLALRGQPDLTLMMLDGRCHLSWGASGEVPVRAGWQQRVREQVRSNSAGLPVPFAGGVMGHIGYEAGRHSEVMPAPKTTENLWDGVFRRFDGALVLMDSGWVLAGQESWVSGAEKLLAELPLLPPRAPSFGLLTDAPPDVDFASAVAVILERIAAGELYQVNLSRRLLLQVGGAPERLFGQLPLSAHGAFLRLSPQQVLMSNSPELFWSLRQGQVTTLPIKGTAPLGQQRRLLADPKERAELTMIVDLMRNDLGRVCRSGSVQAGPRELTLLPNLLHAQQRVSGCLAVGRDALDLMDASFPPGSVTGAPKVQAMRLISALEPCPRGAYTGAIGAFMDGGDAEFGVAIRVAQWRSGELAVHVGGGIVADSLPASEVAETWLKAQGWLNALLDPQRRP